MKSPHMTAFEKVRSSKFVGSEYKNPQIRRRTCAFPPTPHTPQQPLMDECGLLFQIIVKPQRDLGRLLLSIAKECVAVLPDYTMLMKYEHKSHQVFSSKVHMMCLDAIFTKWKLQCAGHGLETLE